MEIIKALIKDYQFTKSIGNHEYTNGNLIIIFNEENKYVTLRFEDKNIEHNNHRIFEVLGKFNVNDIEELNFELNKRIILKN